MSLWQLLINNYESLDTTYFHGKYIKSRKKIQLFFVTYKKFLKTFPKIMVFSMCHWVYVRIWSHKLLQVWRRPNYFWRWSLFHGDIELITNWFGRNRDVRVRKMHAKLLIECEQIWVHNFFYFTFFFPISQTYL